MIFMEKANGQFVLPQTREGLKKKSKPLLSGKKSDLIPKVKFGNCDS